MAYTHEYSLTGLPRKDIGADKEVITEIHVAIKCSDGKHEAARRFIHVFDELEAPFASLATLDKPTILGWIPAECKIDWEKKMEVRVAKDVAKLAANERDDVPAGLI